ncbi:MAG: CPBP family intramembrane metalloprotease [Ktedonobacteraceae bacterium]|nr:CPBP family intramembrane metalloprotease [Ktedonobacteraceae bacterium]MBV9614613.1 CPBP family intramembrane metalloprotease [Ktedonobacteraceae bacterium]
MGIEQSTSKQEVAEASWQIAGVSWANIALFVVLAFALSWCIWIVLRAVGIPLLIYGAIGMFGPTLASVIVRLVRHEGFADAGLRLVGRGVKRGGWMYLAAYVSIPLLLAAGIGLALLTEVQHWAFASNLHQLGVAAVDAVHKQGRSLPAGMTGDQLALVSIGTQTILAFTLAILFNMIFTFGEEFGWRGYLLPRLAPLGGVRAALITGIIWGLWHAPVIVLAGYNYPGHPWLGIGMMVVFTTSLSLIFAWLRFRSGSIWPSTLAHAALNGQAGFALILLSHADPLIGAPIGIIGVLPMLAFGGWLAATGRLRPTRGAEI